MPPASEAAAYRLLERLRWGDDAPACPRCGVVGRCFLLRAVDGGRRTRTGAVSDRRVWKCGACRGQFSVLVGTVAQGSRIPARVWAAVLADWTPVGAALSVGLLTERFAVSRAAARQLLRRLTLAAGLCADGAVDGAALLRLPPAEVARIRAATPARVRPRPQRGPTADYG